MVFPDPGSVAEQVPERKLYSSEMTHIDPVLTLVPPGFFLLILLSRRHLSRTRFLAGILLSVAILYWTSWPGAWLSSASLERFYPPVDLPRGDAEAIVVFAAGAEPVYPTHPRLEAQKQSYWRTRHAAWLYHHWKPLPIVVCGGPINRSAREGTLAEMMREILIREGIPAEAVWLENASGDTHENAQFAAQILRARGIRRVALVTEGYHMLRSELSLRKQGIAVVPAPCCFFTQRPPQGIHDWLPNAELVRRNYQALHEWIGLAWYWLRGWV